MLRNTKWLQKAGLPTSLLSEFLPFLSIPEHGLLAMIAMTSKKLLQDDQVEYWKLKFQSREMQQLLREYFFTNLGRSSFCSVDNFITKHASIFGHLREQPLPVGNIVEEAKKFLMDAGIEFPKGPAGMACVTEIISRLLSNLKCELKKRIIAAAASVSIDISIVSIAIHASDPQPNSHVLENVNKKEENTLLLVWLTRYLDRLQFPNALFWQYMSAMIAVVNDYDDERFRDFLNVCIETVLDPVADDDDSSETAQSPSQSQSQLSQPPFPSQSQLPSQSQSQFQSLSQLPFQSQSQLLSQSQLPSQSQLTSQSHLPSQSQLPSLSQWPSKPLTEFQFQLNSLFQSKSQLPPSQSQLPSHLVSQPHSQSIPTFSASDHGVTPLTLKPSPMRILTQSSSSNKRPSSEMHASTSNGSSSSSHDQSPAGLSSQAKKLKVDAEAAEVAKRKKNLANWKKGEEAHELAEKLKQAAEDDENEGIPMLPLSLGYPGRMSTRSSKSSFSQNVEFEEMTVKKRWTRVLL
ncbi:hypothetical protein HDU98_001396, partial [Podochytrium sp. JEL0797]